MNDKIIFDNLYLNAEYKMMHSLTVFYAPAALPDEDQCSSQSFPRRLDCFFVATGFWHLLKRKRHFMKGK